MTEFLELGRLSITLPINYSVIKNVRIFESANEHGFASIHLVLTEILSNNILSKLDQSPVEIRTPDNDLVFYGACVSFEQKKYQSYAEITISAKSLSHKTDITKNSRTFQSEGKTLEDILNRVLAPYNPLLHLEQNPSISQMVSQQDETDWTFIKRIANQFGLSVFTNARSHGLQISVGVVPFSLRTWAGLPDSQRGKNLTALRALQQTSRPDIRAFEVEQYGGTVLDLDIGAGHAIQCGARKVVVFSSEISSFGGLLHNNVYLTDYAGAIPQPAEIPHIGTLDNADNAGVAHTPPQQLHSSNVISGKVTSVSGSNIMVQFDADAGANAGTRWIPYASGLSDCVYVMPDEGDTVFCYFENDGNIVCLGSKAASSAHPDFDMPEDKSLTYRKKMVKFKGHGLDITANRDEVDGKGGMQLKITLSDTDGIEVAATKDVVLKAQDRIYIQGVEQESASPVKTQEILNRHASLMEQFKTMDTTGADYHTAQGGPLSDANMTDAVLAALQQAGMAVVDDIASPFIWLKQSVMSLASGPEDAVDNTVTFEDVSDKQVMIFGLNRCVLQVQNCKFILDGSNILVEAPQYRHLGMFRGRVYGHMEEEHKSFMDSIMDGVQCVLDIVSIVGHCIPPIGTIVAIAASGVNAGISLCRGDYGRAASSLLGCIPGGGLVGGALQLAGKVKKLAKVARLLKIFETISDRIGMAQLGFGFSDAKASAGNFFSVLFSNASGQDKLDAAVQMADALKGYIGPAINGVRAVDASRKSAPDGPKNETDPDAPKNNTDDPAQGNKVPKDQTSECGDPIDMVTGSQRMTNTDFIVKDFGEEFRLVRTYESLYENKGGLLGSRWFFNIEVRVWQEGGKATVIMPDMHLEHFISTDFGWRNERSGTGVYRLTQSEAGFILYFVREKKQYQFDTAGNLSVILDRNGNRIWFRYLGNTLQSVEFASGQVLNFIYHQNKLAAITDVLGRKVCYSYEGELLNSVRLADEGVICYAYTREGWLTSVIDQNGHEYVRNSYDWNGRVTRQFLATGEEFVVLYDDSDRVTRFQTVGKSDQTAFYYNIDNLVEKTVYADGSFEQKRYDVNKNIIWQKDRNGGELHRKFNEQGQLLEEHLPNGLITYFAYDDCDNMVREWNNCGGEKSFKYDASNNRTEISQLIENSLRSTSFYEHDTAGRIVSIKDANGNVTKYGYHQNLAAPATITFANGAVIHYEYDMAGRCLSVKNEFGQRQYGYNNLDYMCLSVDELKRSTAWEFDRLGNMVRFLLPNQHIQAQDDHIGTHFYYDAMDKQIISVDSMGSIVATPRDAYGNIRKEINPNSYDVTTKDGDGISYDYDAEDRRIRIHYPDGGTERIFYDCNGNIIKKVEATSYDKKSDDGAGYCYAYDSVNRLVCITNPDGEVQKAYVYDLCGSIIKEIDANGYLSGDNNDRRIGTLYRYNACKWLVEKRTPVKSENNTVLYRLTAYAYDFSGNMTDEMRYCDFQTEDSSCGVIHRIHFSYDTNNRLVMVSDGTGAVVEYGYDSMNRRISERRKLAEDLFQTFRYHYDAVGQLIKLEQSADEDGHGKKFASTIYKYDLAGNILHVKQPSGSEVLREYDIINRLLSETHKDKASGIDNRTEFAYDKAGNLIAITDTQGRKTLIAYDLLNREIRRTEKDGGVQRRIYDPNGRLAKLVRPNQYDTEADNGAGYQYTYDLQGRVVTVLAPNGTVLQTNTYTPDGQLLQQLDGAGGGASFGYDLAGNRLRIETKGGASQDFDYDAAGNIIGIVDGNQNRTGYQLDKWGRITQVLKADGSTEFYTYDYAGNMTTSTDGEGHTTQYEYNRAGLMSRLIDPLGEAEAYAYDGMGRMVRKTDRNGNSTEYGYTFYDAPLYRRNQATGLEEVYAYTPDGLLRAAIGGGMRYSYEYDEMGRLLRKSASGRALLEHAYDQNGNRTSLTDITGKKIEYLYDSLDMLTEVYENGSRLSAYDYNPDGTIKSLQNGPLHTLYSYDLDKNMTGLQVAAAGQLLADNRYSYDSNGNRLSKQQLGGDTSYAFDALNQLTKVQYPTITEELFYNKAGNRIRRTADGVEELYQYDPRNRLTQLSRGGVVTPFRYDSAGNLLADDKALYSYDAFNRTTKVESIDGNVQVNRYDAEGLRHELEENGRLVQFIFNDSREVVAEQAENKWTLYIRASSLLASSTDHARTYYHYASDEMGSTTHIVDGEGGVQNTYAYDAWGNVTKQTENVPNRFKFNGQQLDPISQQYYLRARFYNPVIARFTQEDTYRGDGLNLYAYCGNNPICYADPMGHEKTSPWGTDDKGRKTYTDNSGNSFKQDANGNWHDSSGEYCADPTRANQPKGSASDVPDTKPHGNGTNSTKLNHIYVIVDQNGDLLKVGISGQPLNKNGTSPRANPQVSNFNKTELNTHAIIIETGLTRTAALALEQKITDRHAARNGGAMPSPYHQRPLPNVSSIEGYVQLYGELPNKSTGGKY